MKKATSLKVLVLLSYVSLCLLLVSMWQIEMIWISIQNGWSYNLPFNILGYGGSYDWWFWHDLWFVLIFISYLLITIPSLFIVINQTQGEKTNE